MAAEARFARAGTRFARVAGRGTLRARPATRDPRLLDARLALAALALLLALALGCSPEASRSQGDGAGADIGNHSQTTPLHGDGVMFYNTPREGQAITK